MIAIFSPPCGAKIAEGAERQLARPATYDAAYFRIGYPGGDVPADRGACVDVIIRAMRYAGYDLQVLIHEDVVRHFRSYPRREAHPDANIDHRRVPNQIYYFRRHALVLPTRTTGRDRAAWQPGDFVYWKLPSGLDHCGVLAKQPGSRGLPLVIHNLRVTAKEDVLDAWQITGHFRFTGDR